MLNNNLHEVDVATELALHRILPSVYPEFIWYPWKFHKVPEQFWFNHNNRRAYFDWLFEKLQLRTQHDWYGGSISSIDSLLSNVQ
jgi:hypothetical protein